MIREPYTGLRPFAEEDAASFFGRDEERELLIANLTASRLTVLYGASGVGKSSVLQAGVVHHLNQLARSNRATSKSGNPKFVITSFRLWNEDPISGVLNGAKQSITSTFADRDMELSYNSRDLAKVLRDWVKQIDCKLLIVLDQFEDYFLYHDYNNAESEFDSQLARAVNDAELRVNFLISLRDDSLSKLDRFKSRIPSLFDNYLRITHLDGKSATEAISGPVLKYYNKDAARSIGVSPELINAVLRQVEVGRITLEEFGGGQTAMRSKWKGDVKETELSRLQIETSYLQLVMQRLWKETIDRNLDELKLSTLKRLGDVSGIVQRYVEEVMEPLPLQQKDLAEKAFHYLVTPNGTKIAHNAKDLSDSINDVAQTKRERVFPEDLSNLLMLLDDKRIVRSVASSDLQQAEYKKHELFHDILAPAILRWRINYRKEKAVSEEKKRARQIAISATIAAFVLGIVLTVMSYRYNWFGARTAYLAAKNSTPLDVVDWLINRQVRGNIVYDDVNDKGTQRALVALRFAYELDPGNQKTKDYLEDLLVRTGEETRQRSARLEVIRDNIAILDTVYDFIPYERIKQQANSLRVRAKRLQDSTYALTLLNSLDASARNPNIADTSLLRGYGVLRKGYLAYVDSGLVKRKYLELDTVITRFKQNQTLTASDTATILQQKKAWEAFLIVHPRNSPERMHAQNEISKLNEIAQTSATIASEENFVTCRSIENLVPQGIGNRFSTGNICAWAKINFARSERITFKWYTKGALFHTTSFNVAATSNYRVHAAKNYGPENSGTNEVRVYNGSNLLIGRRTFTVR